MRAEINHDCVSVEVCCCYRYTVTYSCLKRTHGMGSRKREFVPGEKLKRERGPGVDSVWCNMGISFNLTLCSVPFPLLVADVSHFYFHPVGHYLNPV